MSDVILYTTEDGKTQIDLRLQDGTVRLSQLQIAELFQTSKHNVSIHTKNIFEDGELTKVATVKESLTVQIEGKREVQRTIDLYNLDLSLAVGYRTKLYNFQGLKDHPDTSIARQGYVCRPPHMPRSERPVDMPRLIARECGDQALPLSIRGTLSRVLANADDSVGQMQASSQAPKSNHLADPVSHARVAPRKNAHAKRSSTRTPRAIQNYHARVTS